MRPRDFPRFAELAVAVIAIWVILGGWAFLDAFTAATRRERNRDLVRAAAFIPVAVALVWVLAWFAAKSEGGDMTRGEAADEGVFGPPDGPRQVPLWEQTGPPASCPDCGSSWRGLGRQCWKCADEAVSA